MQVDALKASMDFTPLDIDSMSRTLMAALMTFLLQGSGVTLNPSSWEYFKIPEHTQSIYGPQSVLLISMGNLNVTEGRRKSPSAWILRCAHCFDLMSQLV